ncbi:MAG: hypothetical protein D3924_16240 [Candidatus Electrothrix sp. AR4]|nr:hypothetical protein [Candidatus Electrothrix sp. AR4]
MDSSEIIFRRMGADEDRPLFYCGSQDLNEFFHEDSKEADRELVAVTYAVEIDGSTVAFFCVSNDSIRAEDTTRSRFKKIRSSIPATKRYANMPAVKIGRLATNSDFQSQGIGTRILDLIVLRKWRAASPVQNRSFFDCCCHDVSSVYFPFPSCTFLCFNYIAG